MDVFFLKKEAHSVPEKITRVEFNSRKHLLLLDLFKWVGESMALEPATAIFWHRPWLVWEEVGPALFFLRRTVSCQYSCRIYGPLRGSGHMKEKLSPAGWKKFQQPLWAILHQLLFSLDPPLSSAVSSASLSCSYQTSSDIILEGGGGVKARKFSTKVSNTTTAF